MRRTTDEEMNTWRKRLAAFLTARGCAPQPSGVWPVNHSDAIDFAREAVEYAEELLHKIERECTGEHTGPVSCVLISEMIGKYFKAGIKEAGPPQRLSPIKSQERAIATAPTNRQIEDLPEYLRKYTER